MQKFNIKKLKKNLKIKKLNEDMDGFRYRFKNRNELDVKEIIILNSDMVNHLISTNFDKKYKKILAYYFNVLATDEDSDDALMIALNEIARLRFILIKKYKRFLTKETESKLLKKLKILENEIRSKIIDIKLIKEQELTHTNIEEKSKSR